MTAIEFDGVRFAQLGAPAVGPLDLVIQEGERVTVVGDHGPETLVRLLSGEFEPTTGHVRVGGLATDSAEVGSMLSVMADASTLDDEGTVLAHLELAARRAPSDDWQSDVDDLARRFTIDDRLSDRVFTLSTGMRQRVLLCMALVRRFEILVLNEPFGGLDADGRRQLTGVLALAHDQGCALLLATHDLDAVLGSDRVIGLRDGVVAYDGPPGPDVNAVLA